MPTVPTTPTSPTAGPRTRPDRCPGALRPWPADDGLLVRLRLVGGRVPAAALQALAAIADDLGDGRIHVTGRANLQLRAMPGDEHGLAVHALAPIVATGLLPSLTHELARNVMVSPQTGLAGGRADLRPVAAELDRLVCADDRLSALPGRFLFVLDDGRGDLIARTADLGVVALDERVGRLRIGDAWGPVVPLASAAAAMAGLAAAFVEARGTGPDAAWHVTELAEPPAALATIARSEPPDPRLPEPAPALPYGAVPGGHHVAVPDDGLDRAAVDALADRAATGGDLVVTPWRGVLVPSTGADR